MPELQVLTAGRREINGDEPSGELDAARVRGVLHEVEEMGFDITPTAGAVMRLLERGWEAIPSIYDLPLDCVDVGLRPGSRDNEPLVGASGIDGLYHATGHHRHGILLAPITAYALADIILEGKTPPLLEPFQPSRFNRAKRSC